jgi:hypothetical protein
MSCTDCGRKGGCDAHKGGMFAAIEETLARLYPTRRWTERDDEAAFGAGVTAGEGASLGRALAARLKAMALYRPGGAEETCDYVYVLCVGRPPSLLEAREGLVAADAVESGDLAEVYLRVALSTVARFAAVQQVAMHAVRHQTGEGEGAGELAIVETPRTGVFDPILLKRYQKLVGVLAEHDVRNLDFGELLEPPPGFDPADYAQRYGGAPSVANYFFYPQPASAVTTTILPAAAPPAT